MTSNTSDESPVPVDPAPGNRQPPRDFAELARRISSRTTDLLTVALVGALLLALGVQATRWWRPDPPQFADARTVSAPLAIWDVPSDLSLEFTTGDWSLRRDSVTGNADAATTAALNAMRHALERSSPQHRPAVDAAEQQWLDQLRDWPPSDQIEHGDIYALGGPWPWVIAATHTGAEDRHIAGWAFALPHATDRWTLYVAERAADRISKSTTATDVPLPANAARAFGIRSTTGGFVTFRCAFNRLQCQSDWDRQLSAANWTRTGDWLIEDQQSRAMFVRPNSDRLHVLLREAEDRGTTGAADWTISPEPPEAP